MEAALAEKALGNEAYKKRNFAAALTHYEKAIELVPTEITFRSNLAAVYFEQKNYAQCIATCEKVLTSPNDSIS